jgi:hypothetical protein
MGEPWEIAARRRTSAAVVDHIGGEIPVAWMAKIGGANFATLDQAKPCYEAV